MNTSIFLVFATNMRIVVCRFEGHATGRAVEDDRRVHTRYIELTPEFTPIVAVR